MSNNIRIRFLVVLPALFFLAFAVVSTDLGALAQNANSSETTGDATQNDNANANAGEAAPQPARRRRGRRRAAAATDAAPADAGTGAGAQETDTGVNSPGEQTDLSGTWTGRVRMTGGHEMAGEGTLTITGNTFTLAAEGMNHTGRIIAITTRGYTGATLWFTDITDPTSNTPLAAAVSVRRGRNTITLAPVPGARNRLNFNGRASG